MNDAQALEKWAESIPTLPKITEQSAHKEYTDIQIALVDIGRAIQELKNKQVDTNG